MNRRRTRKYRAQREAHDQQQHKSNTPFTKADDAVSIKMTADELEDYKSYLKAKQEKGNRRRRRDDDDESRPKRSRRDDDADRHRSKRKKEEDEED